MAKLIEQSIDTLFQGVSRQPATVRLPGQVEEADNVVFSVVTGGFERRPGTEHVAPLDFLSSSVPFATYTYERDADEKYWIFIEDGDLKVCDLSGDEKTVSFPDGKDYLPAADPENEFAFVTISDYTFVVNKTVTVAMDEVNVSNDPDISSVIYGKESYTGNRIFATINGVEYDGGNSDNVKGNITGLYTTLSAGLGAAWVVEQHDEFLYVARVDGADFTISVSTSVGESYAGHVKRKVQQFSDLPQRAPVGMKVNVIGDRSSDFAGYWVRAEAKTPSDTSNLASVVWREAVAPGIPITIDAATMPHQLIRNADGTFTFQKATWGIRRVGDVLLTPDPEFIGRKLQDIVFHRDRLALVSDENVTLSQAGDYLNFWPEKALDVLDSDPISRSSPTSRVNLLNFAVPFRRSLFLTSDKQQFELSGGDALTPRTAKLEAATRYDASRICRPLALADTLYFPTSSGNGEIVWEYLYDDETLNTVAADVTKHVQGYVPSPTLRLAGDGSSSTLFLLSGAARDALYPYQVYWNGNEKAQAAWGRWVFADAEIHAMEVINGYLYLVISRDNIVYLERLPVSNEFTGSTATMYITATNGRIPVRLDQRVSLTGTYVAETNATTWALPWGHDDAAIVVLGDGFNTPGRVLNVTYPTGTTVSATGDFSGSTVIIGRRFLSSVALSRIYPREGQNDVVTSGRLQLRSISFDYQNTSYFEVVVTPRLRDPETWAFTGRIIGDGGNIIGEIPLAELGAYRVRAKGSTLALDVRVQSDAHTPFTITSTTWVGLFNEITRQEAS